MQQLMSLLGFLLLPVLLLLCLNVHVQLGLLLIASSQDAKVDLKLLIVAVMPIYCLSETINVFFFLFLCVLNKLIIFSVS